MRSGWKSSSASTFSPTPISLIGLPVTARIESAAPPRPSPSTRVSTMPVSAERPSKALAVLTASWPVSASATSSVSCGFVAALMSARLVHQLFVDRGAAGGVEHDDVIAAELARASSARCAICERRSDRRRSGGSRRRSARRARASCSCAAGRRVSSDAISTFLRLRVRQALGDLGGGRRLARALQADHQDHHRRRRIEVDRLRRRRRAYARARHGRS